jgi:G3E family GTPase
VEKKPRMRLILVAGFLGSGKTTLLIHIARRLTAAGRKIAIIENEAGEIGIDGNYLRQNGLEVQELYGGCICCTLSVNLIATLQKIHQLLAPDVVLMEPTGLARPGDIVAAVRSNVSAVIRYQVVVLVDAVRFEMLMSMLTPLLTAQIEAANVVVINKIDEVDQAVLKPISRRIRELNPHAQIMTISAEKAENLEPLLDELA